MTGRVAMSEIKGIVERIPEELADAKYYANMAEVFKEKDPAFSRLLVELSNAELGHADKLHTQATTVIETYRKEYGEPDARMLKRFNEKHIQCMEKAASIKEQLSDLAKK